MLDLVALFYSNRYHQNVSQKKKKSLEDNNGRGKEIPPRKDVVCLLYSFCYTYLNINNGIKMTKILSILCRQY